MSGVAKFQNTLGIVCLAAGVLTTALSNSPDTTHAFVKGAVLSVPLGFLMWLNNRKPASSPGDILRWPYFVGIILLIFLQPDGHVPLIAYGCTVVGGAVIFKRVLLLLPRRHKSFNSPHPQ